MPREIDEAKLEQAMLGQNLKVGLGHRGKHAQKEVGGDKQHRPLVPADLHAHPLAHGDHGDVHAHGEQAHAGHQQDGAEQKQHQGARRQGCNGDGEQKHNGRDGQHTGQRFPVLLLQLWIQMQGKTPFRVRRNGRYAG